EHHHVSRRRSPMGMRRRFGVMIGLHLDDDAADAVDQQGRADQVGSDIMHAAPEKRAREGFAESRWIWAIGCQVLSQFHAAIGAGGWIRDMLHIWLIRRSGLQPRAARIT